MLIAPAPRPFEGVMCLSAFVRYESVASERWFFLEWTCWVLIFVFNQGISVEIIVNVNFMNVNLCYIRKI